ncbi:PIN domain-containing protein [Synechococcus sp. CS-1324]|uniref:PIN domain-containing protein n=1 Tax=Synechococcus sp. CS-1324 TaxID=2847980 RepID=UPI0028804B99|nr:PIN domain-containing protein [Synechococcus sp. CS-1324]MCT0229467.1 PIN domain-containing protein [Synechococcus sp. CS-1324]
MLFTAAHNPDGKAAFLITLGQSGLIQLATSAYAKEEARRNLARKFPHCMDRFLASIDGLRLVSDDCDVLCPAGLPEKDWPIYRAAHACKADVLVTGDLRDFGPLMNAPERTAGLLVQTVAEGEGLEEGGDAELLGEFEHPAPGAVVAEDAAQDHRRVAALQAHLELGMADRGLHAVVPVGGGDVGAADQDAPLGGIPFIGDVVEGEQIGGESPRGKRKHRLGRLDRMSGSGRVI